MIMAGGPSPEDADPVGQLVRSDDPTPGQGRLKGLEPALVVAVVTGVGAVTFPPPDGGDELVSELVPWERAVFIEGDGDAEDTALPRLAEHELAIGAGRRRRSVDVQLDGDPLADGHS